MFRTFVFVKATSSRSLIQKCIREKAKLRSLIVRHPNRVHIRRLKQYLILIIRGKRKILTIS